MRPAASSNGSGMTPPRASDIAPRLLLATSRAPAARPAAVHKGGTSLGRTSSRAARRIQQRVVHATTKAGEFPHAWIGAATATLPLFTRAAVRRRRDSRGSVTRERRNGGSLRRARDDSVMYTRAE